MIPSVLPPNIRLFKSISSEKPRDNAVNDVVALYIFENISEFDELITKTLIPKINRNTTKRHPVDIKSKAALDNVFPSSLKTNANFNIFQILEVATAIRIPARKERIWSKSPAM